MFDIVRKEIEWGGRPLAVETGRIARQADGAVLVTYGGIFGALHGGGPAQAEGRGSISSR